jgi:hypothetical protein
MQDEEGTTRPVSAGMARKRVALWSTAVQGYRPFRDEATGIALGTGAPVEARGAGPTATSCDRRR